jgi:DNA-binding NarL/FixJ family response regulator
MKESPPPAPSSGKRRLFLVDDHSIVREGLAELIDGESDLIVCGQTDNGPRAVEAVGRLKPDLVVVDLSLQNGSGLELIRQLKSLHARLPILVLSMHDEILYAERSLRAGALGYVMKREEGITLLKAIRSVLAGEVFVSESMKRLLLHKAAHHNVGGDQLELPHLSDREIEVFQLLGEGQTTRQIAQRLHVAVSTVETHYAHLKQKLHYASAVELRRAAVAWIHAR